MRPEKIKMILDTCIDIFSDTGLINFAKLVKEIRDSDGSPLSIEALKEEEKKWINFETQKKRRMIAFGDGSDYSVMRYHIVNIRKYWDNLARPCIKLNEMPEEVNLKDNPCKNVVLIYEDDRIRDRDYSRLRIILG